MEKSREHQRQNRVQIDENYVSTITFAPAQPTCEEDEKSGLRSGR